MGELKGKLPIPLKLNKSIIFYKAKLLIPLNKKGILLIVLRHFIASGSKLKSTSHLITN